MRTEDGRIIQECLNGESEAFDMLIDKYIDNKVYLIGGQLGGNGSNVEVYDIAKDEWTKIKNELPTPRGYFGTGQSCCVIDGKIYIIGGTSNFQNNGPVGLSKNEVYTPDIIESKSIDPSGKLPKNMGNAQSKIGNSNYK